MNAETLPPRNQEADWLADPLRTIFTPEVRAKWSAKRATNEHLNWRLNVLEACGPDPADVNRMLEARWYRAHKAAWSVYLQSAFACGMFDSTRGADLRARLASERDEEFRSAMAECMACWLFAGRLGLSVESHAQGRNHKMLDLALSLPGAKVGVEVKSPFRERPRGGATWFGDDSDKIIACFKAANKQFDDKGPNLLVVAPSLRVSIFQDRRVLVRAAFGESRLVFDINEQEGRLEHARAEFSSHGTFLSNQRPSGHRLKSDSMPAHQRISALVSIEEYIQEKHPYPADAVAVAGKIERDRSEILRLVADACNHHFSRANDHWIEHKVFVLHNPYAHHPLAEELFSDFPQLVRRGANMIWTDGYHRPI